MNQYTHTLPREVRAPEGTDTCDTSASSEAVVISVAELMLGTVAASRTTRRPAVHPLRVWWTRYTAARAEWGRSARRRPDYFETAAMAREMHRL